MWGDMLSRVYACTYITYFGQKLITILYMYQKVVGIFTHNLKPETEIVFSHAAATNFPIHVGQYIYLLSNNANWSFRLASNDKMSKPLD